jgi:hypothetical protein
VSTITLTRSGRPTRKSLRSLLSQYRNGKVTKEGIERQLGRNNDKGKYITRLWQSELGVDTRVRVQAPVV